MTAKKGSSAAGGTGHASAPLMRAALLRSLRRQTDKAPKSRQRLQRVADALVDAAIKGEMAALREVFHRVDGKITDAPNSEEGRGLDGLRIRWLTEADEASGAAPAPGCANSPKP
jgi:hypothetical protein